MGTAIFLFAGILIGVILFPTMQTPSLLALPTAVSATIAVALIALLVAKELFFSGQQWRTMNRLLNLGIAPLLMLFFLTVASRLAEMMN
jgi:peptidoglycan biosynthesis protein MviN/MurJ (putative lipid II flippase)